MVLYCIGSRTERLFVITFIEQRNRENNTEATKKRKQHTKSKQYIKQSLKKFLPFSIVGKTIMPMYTRRAQISVGLTWNYSVFICTRLHISSYLSRSRCGMFSLFIPLQLCCAFNGRWRLVHGIFSPLPFSLFYFQFLLLFTKLNLIMNKSRFIVPLCWLMKVVVVQRSTRKMFS